MLVPRVPYESRGTQAALTKEPLHSENSANSNSLPEYHNSSKLILVTTAFTIVTEPTELSLRRPQVPYTDNVYLTRKLP